jgi:multiple sugar transport system substrate-binding protein
VVEAGKDIYSKGLRQVFTDEIYESAIGEPRYPAEVVDAIGNALQNVMFADADPAAEAKAANDKIDQFLQGFQGSM